MEEPAHSGFQVNVKSPPHGGHGPQSREGPVSHALAKNLDKKGKAGGRVGETGHGWGQGRKCLQFWHLPVTCF